MNDNMKNICRRIIRILMGVIGAFLLAVGLVIPMVNNGIAFGLEKELKGLPLPENTSLIDSLSAAGRYDGSAENIRYFGAALLHSEQTLEELQAYYATVAPDCMLAVQAGEKIVCIPAADLRFRTDFTGEGYYILYTLDRTAHLGQGWLNLDIR